ncbi:unnamed protein product [marine sediment metagenome]|uniref:DNA-binding protein HU n=1 Tax=marine sediment metagenome TaxID=412755 RepID=X1EZR0_9ZZZZ
MEAVAAEVGLTKKDVNNVVDAITSAIADSLAGGEEVTLVGFGTFQTQKRKARQGVNPQTGDRISIPAKNIPKFRPGRNLREALGPIPPP